MPSCVRPVTYAFSAARRIGLPWPSRTPWRTSTKSRCASNCTMWIGPCSLKARMQGMLTAWSPPSTTGSAPRSRILRTPLDVGVASRRCRCGRCRRRRCRRCAPCPSAGRRHRPRGRRRRHGRRRTASRPRGWRAGRSARRRGTACPSRRGRRAPRRRRRWRPSRVQSGRLPKVEMPTKGRLRRPDW